MAGRTTPGPTVRQFRHRAEVPMLIVAAVITAAGCAAALALVLRGASVPDWAAATAVGLAGPIVGGTVLIRYAYWRQIANSIEITTRQLPLIHATFLDLVQAMELAYVPRLYVANGNGQLGAFAAKCTVRRGYVVIYSDIVDVATELGDMEAVRFVLAHELAHIKCGHVNLWRTAITTLPNVLLIGRTLTRAQEYTADRCAAFHAPAGAEGMLMLYAGKRLHQHVDLVVHLQSASGRPSSFWLRIVNLLSTHPVGYRRLAALDHARTGLWDVHGEIF